MELILDAPGWLIALCILAGVVYATALYLKDKLNRHFHTGVILGLASLRFVAVSLIALFLLRPLLKTTEQHIEKPVVVIAQDNSESLALGPDSAYYRGEYNEQLKALALSLEETCEVHTLTFGAHITGGLDSLDFSEKSTDYGALLEELHTTYSNRNLGAVVIASDGRYNRGINPIYGFQKLNAPVFTIALGDTSARRDIRVAQVAHNRLAYLGNRFPVEMRIEGLQLSGETATVNLSRKGEVLFSEVIRFDGEVSSITLRTNLDAEETGLQQYVVSVTAKEGEVTTANNRESFFIDVLDSRQQVLLLYKAPHPDVQALKAAISSHANYQVTAEQGSDFTGEMGDYNLVIFHQLPNGSSSAALCEAATEAGVPAWYIWGSGTNFREFNNLNTGFNLTGHTGKSTDSGAEMAEGFSAFTFDQEYGAMFRNFPPLTLPFGNYTTSPGVNPLLFQRIGQIKTEQALMAFNTASGVKLAVTTGEGLWRWRLFNHLEEDNHEAFDQLVTRTVQYLSAKEDKSPFRVRCETDVLEYEAITFEAELYNASYEPVNGPEVTLVITSDQDAVYERVFTRTQSGYRMDAGSLPVGQYQYEARTQYGGKALVERGEFSVSPVQLELTETQANHALMYQFAANNGGEMVHAHQVGSLSSKIVTSGNLGSLIHETRVLNDLIGTRWLLFLILGLLSLEWLWRKRNGTY